MSADELSKAEMFETIKGTVVTEYQYRSLALLGQDFYAYVCKKYPPEYNCVFSIPELQPMFCEIHRAIACLVSEQGLSVHEALVSYFKPASTKARKDGSDGTVRDLSGTPSRTPSY